MPGKTLAAQREAMGWTVEQVADQLKLAVRQVVALEAGDYDSLPSPAVTRGFVRAYAKILKIDAAPLVAMIEMNTPPPSQPAGAMARRDKTALFSEVRFPSHSKRSRLPLGLVAGAVVVGVVAAAAAWRFGLFPAQDEAPRAGTGTTVLESPAAGSVNGAASDTLQSPSVPLISVPPPDASGPAAPAGTAPSAPNPAPDAATAPAGTTPAPAAPSPAPTAPSLAPDAATAPVGIAPTAGAGANTLVLDVREDSWIEVRPAKGRPLVSRLVKAGGTETVEVSEPVTLVVGKPSAVSATLRGSPVDLPLVPGKTVARVALK